jgi:PAS domain S-box-containing protein
MDNPASITKRILVVSPDRSDNSRLVGLLHGLDHQVFEASPGLSVLEALALAPDTGPDLIVLNTDSADPRAAAGWLREAHGRGCPLLLACSGPDHQPRVQAGGLCHRILKPLEEEQVRLAVQVALLEAATVQDYGRTGARLTQSDQAAARQFRRLATVNGIMEAGLSCTDSGWLAEAGLDLIRNFTGSAWGILLDQNTRDQARDLDSLARFRSRGLGAEDLAAAGRWLEEPIRDRLWAGEFLMGSVGPVGAEDPATRGENQFLLGTPLVQDGRVRGVLVLGREEPAYSNQDMEDAMVLAASFSRTLARKRLEEELTENNDRYLNITNQMPLGVYQVDLGTGLFLSVNQVICDFTGYSREELLTMEAASLIDEDSLPVFQARAERILAGLPESNQVDYKIKVRGGQGLWINAISTLEYENNQPVRALVLVRDINDRKLAEEALRESEERYRHLFKYAPAGIYEIDFTTGKLITANDLICEYLGYTRDEMMNMSPISMLSEESLKVFLERLEKMQAGQPVDDKTEYLIRGRDGREFWVVLNNKFFYENGRIKGAFVIAHDITERRRAEAALRLSEEKYRTILESIQEGYFEVDLKGWFVFFSDWFCEVTGYSREEGMGLSFRDYMTPDSAENVEKLFNKIYLTGLPTTKLDYEVVLKNGERRFHQLSASLTRDAAAHPVGFRGVVRDITAQKLAEKELKAALKEKEVLLKEIHHRVKNNMQVISSLLNLQEYQVTDATGREALQDIRGRIMSMALIHEQLYRSTSLARIELQSYALDMAHSLLESYTSNRGAIKLLVDAEEVILDVDQAVPCGLILNEIITNSLKHAFRGSNAGRISIKGRITPDREAELVVGDNGPGLPQDLDWRRTRSMGLSLVVGLAEQQLGGRIELDNTQGAAYTITFPLRDHLNSPSAPKHP